MKKTYRLYYILLVLPFILTFLLLPFMWEEVPMHFNLSGHITRWGSKNELFIFPVIQFCLGIFLLVITKEAGKSSHKAEKKSLLISIGANCVFNFLTYLALFVGVVSSQRPELTDDLGMNLSWVLLVGLILVGIIFLIAITAIKDEEDEDIDLTYY